MVKTCRKCGGTDFRLQKSPKTNSGFSPYCFDCNLARVYAWRLANPERTREIRVKHSAAHREELNAYHRAYYQLHKEKFLARNKANYEKRKAAKNESADRM